MAEGEWVPSQEFCETSLKTQLRNIEEAVSGGSQEAHLGSLLPQCQRRGPEAEAEAATEPGESWAAPSGRWCLNSKGNAIGKDGKAV